MNRYVKFTLLVMCSFLSATSLFARWVTQEEVTRAATATLAKPHFQKHFSGATIASVVELDGIWCVNLAPKGHLIFSGSTKRLPVLAYATGAYVAPEVKRPAFTLQSALRKRAKALERQTVSTFSAALSPIEAEWEALLKPQPNVQLLAVTEEEEEEEVVEEEEELPSEVDLRSDEWNPEWSQCEPWNDFCPQFKAESEATDEYRNRAPVGCVATMYMQIMKYYEWPQRFDAIYAKTLPTEGSVVKDKNGNSLNYEMRFHGGLPIEWNSLYDHYWELSEDGLTRCYSSEKERFPVARLGLLIDTLSEMAFAIDESGTTLLKGCSNEWYDFGSINGKEASEESAEPFTETQLQEIKTVLADGMPLPASIPGHAIFIFGYQEDDEGRTYLGLNYGWNNAKHSPEDEVGSNTYYLAPTVDDQESDATLLEAWILGHCPKLQVQVAPLPKVVNVENLPTLKWCVPTFHEEEFKTFTVSATPYTSATTSLSNLSLEDPTIDTDYFEFVELQDAEENRVTALTIKSTEVGLESYTLPEAFIPTKDSTFSFAITDLRENAEAPVDTVVKVQLWNEVDMAWKTLASFPEMEENGDYVMPETLFVSLADAAERFCKLRFALSAVEASDEEEEEEEGDESDAEAEKPAIYALSCFTLTNVYEKGETKTKKIKTAGTREADLSSLMTEVGARYHVSVSATALEDPVHYGETFTRLTDDAVVMPVIEKVTTSEGEDLIDDILFKGDLYGASRLRVTCNDAVTEVRVWPSCTTLIADDAITVSHNKGEENCFEITIASPKNQTAETLDALDGSRMILTLEARTAQGNVVYRDLSFALRTVIAWEVDEESLEIPRAWFREYGLATDDVATEALKSLAEEDADEDGLLNWQEFLCGTSPIDAMEKLQITNLVFNDEGALEEITYTPNAPEKGIITLEGKTSLTDATWETVDLTTHRFFRLRVTIK